MSNTQEFTLGIDLAQASFDAAIAPEGTNVMAPATGIDAQLEPAATVTGRVLDADTGDGHREAVQRQHRLEVPDPRH